jgi:8-oxo-dGTP pyrophosphatase MutT (NUDIX family)
MNDTETDMTRSPQATPRAPALRPRDSATLILLERRRDDVLVLMGRRHARHVFMPGKFVFPGGRTDPADSRVPIAEGLHPDEEEKLVRATGRAGKSRARAIALSALRETYEEAGLLIGHRGTFASTAPGWAGFVEHGVQPALGALRFVARAVTPPGNVRRFDTRFLACWKEDVAVALPDGGPTDELEEIVWLPLAEARSADIPDITKRILADLDTRLRIDPLLRPGGEVPFYRQIRNRPLRHIL